MMTSQMFQKLQTQKIQLQGAENPMKKKQQITLHKNLQSGKTHQTQQRNPTNHIFSNRALLQKNSDKQSRKLLSQQKIPAKKRSESKASSKQSRQMASSIGKSEKLKSKKKAESVKGSKKTLKRHNSSDQNSVASARHKNIYTNAQVPKQKPSKKPKHANIESSTSSANQAHQTQQPSLTSITESMKSQTQRLSVDHLVEEIQEHEFANLHKLKLHVLNFIFKNRVIKDEQYDRLFQLMVQKFPDKEDLFKNILFEIVSSLDN